MIQLFIGLEDVTVRLETLSNQKPALPPKPANASGSNSAFLFAILTVINHFSLVAASSQVPSTVKSFDEQVEEPIRAFLTICKSIGGDVGAMVNMNIH